MKYPIAALLAIFSITVSAESINLNTSRSNPPMAADRLAGKPTKDQVVQPDEATTVKSSKSNSSERLGKPTKEQVAQPAEAMTLRASKSNSDNPDASRKQSTARNPTVTQGLKVSRVKAPDATPTPTTSKEGGNGEPDKPFKF